MISVKVTLFGRTVLDFAQHIFAPVVAKNETFLEEAPVAVKVRKKSRGWCKSKSGVEMVDPNVRTYIKKLTEEQKAELKWLAYNEKSLSDKEIASQFEIHPSTVCNIRKNRLYKGVVPSKPRGH